MARFAALSIALIVLAAVVVTTAAGDPLNKNAAPISFGCNNGVTFTGTATMQSQTSTGHVIASTDPSLLDSVFQAVQVTVDGVTVKQIAGFTNRSGLVSCTITAFGDEPFTSDTIVLTGFFTGR